MQQIAELRPWGTWNRVFRPWKMSRSLSCSARDTTTIELRQVMALPRSTLRFEEEHYYYSFSDCLVWQNSPFYYSPSMLDAMMIILESQCSCLLWNRCLWQVYLRNHKHPFTPLREHAHATNATAHLNPTTATTRPPNRYTGPLR